MARWPSGIRPSGRGLRIRIWRHGKEIYAETIPCDPHSKTDLQAAIKRRDKLAAKLELGIQIDAEDTGRQSFEVAAQGYLDTVQVDDDTQAKYTNMLNRYWMPAFTGWPVDSITGKAVKDHLFSLEVADKTRKNALSVLSGVMAYAEVNPNPCAGIVFKRRRRRAVERYRPSDREALLSHLDGQNRVYFALLFACGLRPGEALALQWTDYDGQQLRIAKQYTRGKFKDMTKTGVDRLVYVPKWVRPILEAHTTRFKGEHIFENTEGNQERQTKRFNAAWKVAHRRARLRYRDPYTCRHTRAAELLSIGISPPDAAMQLGHSVQMFLETYSEFIVEYADKQDLSRFEPKDEIGNANER